MKILITGAGGYIGSVATYLFLQKGYEVVALDNFATGFHEPLQSLQEKFGKEKLVVTEVDLQSDISQVFVKNKGISAVVHYAASCLVDESMKDPAKYFENNIWGTLNLVENLDKNGIKNLVFSSTSAVYGNSKYVPVDEAHPTNPVSPYGESKLMAEGVVEWFGRLKGINYVIFRYFNVCGASDDGLIGDSKKPSTLLVQNTVRGALGIEPFFLTYPQIPNTPDHSPIRDYVNVVDLNEAHLMAIEYLARGGKSEIMNLGTGNGNSVLEIVETVKKATGKDFKVDKASPRAGDADRLIAKIDKAQEVLGWKPTHTIEDSIKSLMTWYNNHPNGWEK